MDYELNINENNIIQHLDIEKDVQASPDGVFSFNIRLNNGKIVDYTVVEYVNVAQQYVKPHTVLFEELTITRYPNQRNQQDAVRNNISHSNSQEWDDTDGNY